MEVVSVSLHLVLLILVVIGKGSGSTGPSSSSPLLSAVSPSSSSSSGTGSETSASERVSFLLMELSKLLVQQEGGSKDPHIHDDEGAAGHVSFGQAGEGLSLGRSCNSRLLHIFLEFVEEKQQLQRELRQTKEELLQLREQEGTVKGEKRGCHLLLPPLPAQRLPEGLSSSPNDLFVSKEDLVRVIEGFVDSIQEMKRNIEDYQIAGGPEGDKPGYHDCYDLFHSGGERKSGVYTIYPKGASTEGKRVWCDMGEDEGETGGGAAAAGEEGGWTIILNRMLLPTQIDFDQGWTQYQLGFGNPETEYWIGNDVLHLLTTGGKPQRLLVQMEDFDGIKKFSLYQLFSIAGEDDNFRLTIGNLTGAGTAGNALSYHNAMEFTTKDRDNDKDDGQCAEEKKGGFWYKACSTATPTSPIVGKGQNQDQMRWWHFNYDETTLKKLQMKIRPHE